MMNACAERRKNLRQRPGDEALLVRELDADDISAIHDMVSRCSVDTIISRFLGPTELAARVLSEPLTDPERERIDVGAFRDRRLIGLASLAPGLPGTDHLAWDVALMVEDDYQRRGVGTCLAEALVHRAARLPLRHVSATMFSDAQAVLRLARRYAHVRSFSYEGPGVVAMSLELRYQSRLDEASSQSRDAPKRGGPDAS